MATCRCSLYIICFIGVLSPLLGSAERRSDDVDASAVLQQLVNRVNDLEASKTALEAKVSIVEAKSAALETKVSVLEDQIARMKCKSGTLVFRPHDQDLITHQNGVTERRHTLHVTFSPPFADVPEVTSGVIHIDSINQSSATRINVSVSNVATTGFDMTVTEWADSHNVGVGVSWMACSV